VLAGRGKDGNGRFAAIVSSSTFGVATVARPAEIAEDILLDLASRLDSDGGMPGKNRESRASATVIALLAFLSQGHTFTRGANGFGCPSRLIHPVFGDRPAPITPYCRDRDFTRLMLKMSSNVPQAQSLMSRPRRILHYMGISQPESVRNLDRGRKQSMSIRSDPCQSFPAQGQYRVDSRGSTSRDVDGY
jgi:hypothetical protein